MVSLCDKIAVVGIGETEYTMGPASQGAKALISEAVFKALDDAKLTYV